MRAAATAALLFVSCTAVGGFVLPAGSSAALTSSFTAQAQQQQRHSSKLTQPPRIFRQQHDLRCQATATAFDIKRYLVTKKESVDKALAASITPIGKENEKICQSMLYSLMAGGKRVRPILCIAACELFGGTEAQAMPTGVSLEMIHSMSLIHDDLPAMDNDDLRRGKPTNHIVYGEAVAILAGDALLSKSFEHCAKHTKGVSAERVVDVLARLGEAVGEVGLAGGQAMDLELEGRDDTTLEQLRWIHRHKTGALLKVACTAGAILGGASAADVQRMEQFSDAIGLAFQVADDILDCTQTTEQLGKTAGKDEAVSKTTYVKLLGMDGARQEARRLVDSALQALEPYGDRAEALRAIAGFIIDREN